MREGLPRKSTAHDSNIKIPRPRSIQAISGCPRRMCQVIAKYSNTDKFIYMIQDRKGDLSAPGDGELTDVVEDVESEDLDRLKRHEGQPDGSCQDAERVAKRGR